MVANFTLLYSLKRCLNFCAGRVPILVHPSFYRSLKVRFPLDVGGVSRDGRVTTELGTSSLRRAVGILTPRDFRPIINTECPRMALNVASVRTCLMHCECCCGAGDSLHLRGGLSCAGGRLCRLYSIQQLPQRWSLSAS